jgi:GNAT superfamily N-acetyltransferase
MMIENTPMISTDSEEGVRVVYPTHRNEEQIGILLRQPEPDDRALGFVLDSWCKTVAADSPWAVATAGSAPHAPTPTPPSLIKYEHDIILKKIIPHSDITLACDPGDPDTVWGWICFDSELLHFIYVKSAFRGFGIGGALFRSVFSDADRVKTSHRTSSLYVAFPGVQFKWNPYRIFYD